MDRFEIFMLALMIAVLARFFWRDAKSRETVTRWDRVAGRLSLLVMAMAGITMLVLVAPLAGGGLESVGTDEYTQHPFDQELWLASDTMSDEHQLARWRMHKDAATRIRPGMTRDEVVGILGEYFPYTDLDPTRQIEYYVSNTQPGLMRSTGRITVWFKDGVVDHCRVDRPSS